MNVLLVTPWGDHCGIAEHSAQLVEAVKQADPDIHHLVDSDLHPAHVLQRSTLPKLIVLNYHAALLSQWHASHIRDAQQLGAKVICVYHDTGVPNTDQCKRLWEVADAFVVHEPCEDLPGAIYWRMGVPDLDGRQGYLTAEASYRRRPYLGTVGFNFGWKNWPELARITRHVGWGFLICTPEMSEEDEASLRVLNPWLLVYRNLPTEEVLSELHACDATAFVNVCANAGQSGAILTGIGARKPVIALETCRQYRALFGDGLGHMTICWETSFAGVENRLQRLRLGRFDLGIVALAEQESWTHLGVKYAALYRKLVA